MKTAGIIAEYNPFHNGHSYHIAKTRELVEATHVIAVMSGNYVQRGEPAFMNKWSRAKAALSCGVDLVLELPTPWAMSSAEKFAAGAVSILNQIGCVDFLSFGSECGNLEDLVLTANALSTPAFSLRLKEYLEKGYSFPRAREAAVTDEFGDKSALSLRTPNDTLGVEYIKALKGKNIKPIVIERIGTHHDSITVSKEYASSSMLRKSILDSKSLTLCQNLLPNCSYDIISTAFMQGTAPAKISDIAVLSRLRMMSAEELEKLPDVSEGLHIRLYNAIREAITIEELYTLTKTKRYTHSRIRRLVMAAFLNMNADIGKGLPPYCRILGFNQKGAELLKAAKKTTSLPIITRTTAIAELENDAKAVFEFENRATDLFSLLTPTPLPCGLEYTTSPIRV